ncbi:unnamed protein product [Cyclocybe aegerita]|uniref:Uncharacterized protein n=1 Tax=Cyclocybe aegerita TaxID=1973307 RepID=A0A8S0VTS1_CYCAE|nr:unnamed protein product [Cyclocybe aegerita]
MAPRGVADSKEELSHWQRFYSETTPFLALGRRDVHSDHAINLPARPFTHLGVWAYIAFAFMLLAVTTILAYMIYSCCHTAKGRAAACESKAVGPDGRGWVDLPGTRMKSKATISDFDSGKTVVGSDGDMSSEKVRSRRKAVMNIVEMKGLAVSFGHRRRESESSHQMIQMSQPNISQTSLTANGDSFELEYPSLTALPLAHTTDRAATYIPFHLPPPPPSPTPAHKQHVERYRGSIQLSPVSPSPSYMTGDTSPPPLAPRSNISAGRSRANTQTSPRDHREEEPPVEFDSHNIRFAPPLNPFMTQSAAMLWNDPKLSPINGSIITPTSSSWMGSSSPGGSSPSTPPVGQSPLAMYRGDFTIAPVPQEKKRGRVISPVPPGRARAITCPPAIRPSPGHF